MDETTNAARRERESLPQLVKELRSLRGREGLTPEKLRQCPAVLNAVGADDPLEAYKRLVSEVLALGEGHKARALQNAYAISQPHPGLLTDRRDAFAMRAARKIDAVIVWENDMIAELAHRLRRERTGPGITSRHLYVYVRDGLVHMVIETADEDIKGGDGSSTYSLVQQNRNQTTGASPAFPAVIYRLPPDARPGLVRIVVNFEGDSVPVEAWQTEAPTSLGLLYSPRSALVVERGLRSDASVVAEFENPTSLIFLAVFW